MGLGPPVIALYRQFKKFGIFDDVSEVMELGSQNIWCPHGRMLSDLFADFQRPLPSQKFLQDCAEWRGVGRDLYEGLGMAYHCVDTDAKYGALELDINFDSVPEEHRNRYRFVTNHGTTEHLINQLNAFKMIHDFTCKDGYMLHALPFLGQLDHGFFNYHPNLFDCLAMYNSYRNCGMWVGVAYDLSSFIPYQKNLLQHLNIGPNSTGLLVVLLQKMYDTEFQVPFQGVYENTKTEDVSSHYSFVVDGELYEGSRDTFLTKDREFAGELQRQVEARVAAELPQRVAEQVAVQLGAAQPEVLPATAYLPQIGGYDLARELRNRLKKKALELFGTAR